ncbi:hypothetical protein MtrunA17_Chr2g0329851 [Medicago truncatula]|uniref:Uncharacterized protein n=1 Tax=Medicago truncatula TaxID=3880 RepID=A0A396JD89_MEDTR|nr:hypothetical protein MtrunA17_Chr2g0329851 [Medicago truncatula]
MKLPALLSTPGLGFGYTNRSIPGSSPLMVGNSTTSSSISTELELLMLSILTKSPCTLNFHAGILNGGGGGGGGGIEFNGDSLPVITEKSSSFVFDIIIAET